jgi:hypothetical protein
MAMSDCTECWETPCVCGLGYATYTKAARLDLAAAVLGIPRAKLRRRVGTIVPDVHPKGVYPPVKNTVLFDLLRRRELMRP